MLADGLCAPHRQQGEGHRRIDVPSPCAVLAFLWLIAAPVQVDLLAVVRCKFSRSVLAIASVPIQHGSRPWTDLNGPQQVRLPRYVKLQYQVLLQRFQGMFRGCAMGAVGRQHHQLCRRTSPCQGRYQIQGGIIRPLQVLEDEDERFFFCQFLQRSTKVSGCLRLHRSRIDDCRSRIPLDRSQPCRRHTRKNPGRRLPNRGSA